MSGLLAACGGDDDDDDDGQEPTVDEQEPDSPADATATPEQDDEEGEPTESDGEAATGGQAVYGGLDLDEPSSMFSGAARGADALDAFRLIANGIVRLSTPEMSVEPDLAASWDISPDGTEFSFELHEGVLWQDGEAFSADDIRFSFDVWINPEWPEELTPALGLIEGATAFKEGSADEISGISVTDDTHIQFTLTNPDSLFLSQTATRQILPEHLLTDINIADVEAEPFARQPIYTGPFILEEWRPSESMTFTAFDDYFMGRPNLDRIIRRITADPATAIAELRSGEADLGLIAADNLSQFESDDAFRVVQMSGGVAWYWSFDLTLPIFEDRRVRQAMNHALDRQAIIDAIFLGMAEPIYSVTSPLQWIYNPDAPTFEYDEDRANELLDEAGWVRGDDGVREKDGQRLQFQLNVTDTTQDWAIAAQPFLEAVGVSFELNFMDFGTWIANLEVGSYEAAYNGTSIFDQDPRVTLETLFRVPRAGVDWSGYDDPEVNDLFEQAHLATDPDEQVEIYHRIQEIVREDAPFVFTWSPQNLFVIRNDLDIPDVENLQQLYDTAPQWQRSG